MMSAIAPWRRTAWHTPRGIFLAELVTRHGLIRGVEVGVKTGETLRTLLSICPALHMVGVDLWEQAPADGEYAGWDQRRHHKAAQQVAADFPGRCELWRMDSLAAAEQLGPGAMELVFIDADHSEGAVRADIEAWRPLVAPGGVLAGHDINQPGVAAAVAALLPAARPGPDRTWWQCC